MIKFITGRLLEVYEEAVIIEGAHKTFGGADSSSTDFFKEPNIL